jgi:hypothetical protein
MTRRELPAREWPRLAHTELGSAVWALPPATRIVVVEEEAVIVGCWAVVPCTHVEGLWIAPAHRGRGRVGAHLLAGMRAIAHEVGVHAVLTAAITDEVRQLITHYGGLQLAGDHYVLPVGGR